MTRLGWDAGGAYTAALHRHPDAHALLSAPPLAAEPHQDLGVGRVDHRLSRGIEL